MKNDARISTLQISLIIMTAIGLKNHVTVIPHLLNAGKRDSWISVLIALGFILLWTVLLAYIHKKSGKKNIFQFIDEQFGKVIGWMFACIVSFVFVLLAATTLQEFISWTKVSYLPLTPTYFNVILFSILCFLLSLTHIQTMAILNTFVLAAVIVFGIFVALANIQFKDYSLLTPVLEHGITLPLKGVIYPLSGLIEVMALLFVQHKVRGKITYRLYLFNSFILAWLILGPLIGAITEFGPLEAARQKYPAFEEWGLVTLGRFIEHVDFLSIYQWITGAFIRISFLLFLSAEPFAFKKKRSRTILLAGFSLFMIIINLVPISDMTLYHFISRFLMPFTFYFFFAVSLVLGIAAFKAGRQNRRDNYVQTIKKETAGPN